ncbi:hypothetical protein JHK86_000995 [Glycine max]|nr:hypothetical protein JHK86_000995 [Glycine max]
MTTHLLIMYSLALCSLRTPPIPLLDDILLFEPVMEALSIFISSMNSFRNGNKGVLFSLFFLLSLELRTCVTWV